MNETEKKAFAALSEEEKTQIAGGKKIDETTELTKEQCTKLKETLIIKSPIKQEPFRPALCKYGGPGMFNPKHQPVIDPESFKLFKEDTIKKSEESNIE